MVCCCVQTCKSRSDSKKQDGITFHKFPRDSAKTTEWLEAIGRPFWVPGNSSRVCSIHFFSHQLNKTYASGVVKVRDDAVPSLELPTSGKNSKPPVIIQTGFLVFTGKKAKNKVSKVTKKQLPKRRTKMPRKRKTKTPSIKKEEKPCEILSSVGLLPIKSQNKENEVPKVEIKSEPMNVGIQANYSKVIEIESSESSGEGSSKENMTDEEAKETKKKSISTVKKTKLKMKEEHQKSILLTKRKSIPSQKLLLSRETFSKRKPVNKKSPVKKRKLKKEPEVDKDSSVEEDILPESPMKDVPPQETPLKDIPPQETPLSDASPQENPLKENNLLSTAEKSDESPTPCVVLAPTGPCPVTWVMLQEGPGPDGTLPPPKLTPTLCRIPYVNPQHTPKNNSKILPVPKTNEIKGSPPAFAKPKPNETFSEMNMRFKLISVNERLSKKRKEVKVLTQQNRRLRQRLIKEKETLKRHKELLKEAEREKIHWRELPELGKLIFKLHLEDYPHSGFPMEVKNFAVNLYGMCPKAYKFLRACFKGLPHPRTIHKWFSKEKWPKTDGDDKLDNSVTEDVDVDTENYVVIDKNLIPEDEVYEIAIDEEEMYAKKDENKVITVKENEPYLEESNEEHSLSEEIVFSDDNCDIADDSSEEEIEESDKLLECVLEECDDSMYPAEIETASIEVVISE